jgi:HEAT repeat protein
MEYPPTRMAALLLGVAASAMLMNGCTSGEGFRRPGYSQSAMVALDPPQDADLHNRAVNMLQQAAESPEPLLRANAIEALQASPGDLDKAARMGLVDANRGVRFVAAMAVGRQRMTTIVHLVDPLTRDESDSVKAAAMFALHSCGRKVDLSPLAAMLESTDAEVKGNAALVLGELGNKSAASMVRQAVKKPMPLANPSRVRIVELQLAETLVRLGDEQEIEPIRAAMLAPGDQSELTALACQMAGRLKDEYSRATLVGIVDPDSQKKRPPEVRLAAAAALAQMGGSPPRMIQMIEPFVTDKSPFLRAQAAITLGFLGGERPLAILGGMLRDQNPLVQLSAARGILEITGPARGR